MRYLTMTTCLFLVSAMTFAVASPARGGIVSGGLIGAHDANTYNGAGPWMDETLGDNYDAMGTPDFGIIHTAPNGADPGYWSGFSSGQITFDTGPGVIGTGDFTFSLWVNKSSGPTGSHKGFIGDNSGNGFAVYQVRDGDGSTPSSLRSPISIAGGNYQDSDTPRAHDPDSGASAIPGITPLFDGTWHLYTVTRSGGNMFSYFDADNATHETGNHTAATDMSNNPPLHINGNSITGRILSGEDKVNKMLLWNRVLSQAEIAQNVAAGPTALIGPGAPPSTDGTWSTGGIGHWDDGSNWNIISAPSTPNSTATFGNAISKPTTVVVDTDVTAVNSITFDHSISYAVGGLGSINLTSSTHEEPTLPSINVDQGDHQFQVVTHLANDTTVNVVSNASLAFNHALNLTGNTVTKTGAGTLAINNRLNAGQGGLIDVQAGTLSGDGTVGGDVSNSGGAIAPGNSPGVLTIDGNLDNGVGGTVAIEIEGTAGAGDPSGHDQIQVTGSSTLAGTLDITTGAYSDPTVRATVDSFSLIASAGGSTGTFDTVNFNDTALTTAHQGNGLFRNVIYDANNVTFENLLALEGDADGDKDIDITDFNILASNFDDAGANSATNSWTTADFDADGDIDITDFNFLASNFADSGYISGPGGGQVPEPTTLVLLLLGSLFGVWSWRR